MQASADLHEEVWRSMRPKLVVHIVPRRDFVSGVRLVFICLAHVYNASLGMYLHSVLKAAWWMASLSDKLLQV